VCLGCEDELESFKKMALSNFCWSVSGVGIKLNGE